MNPPVADISNCCRVWCSDRERLKMWLTSTSIHCHSGGSRDWYSSWLWSAQHLNPIKRLVESGKKAHIDYQSLHVMIQQYPNCSTGFFVFCENTTKWILSCDWLQSALFSRKCMVNGLVSGRRSPARMMNCYCFDVSCWGETVSKATLGKLPRDGAERIWALPSA